VHHQLIMVKALPLNTCNSLLARYCHHYHCQVSHSIKEETEVFHSKILPSIKTSNYTECAVKNSAAFLMDIQIGYVKMISAYFPK
jgi:hypothetical protein